MLPVQRPREGGVHVNDNDDRAWHDAIDAAEGAEMADMAMDELEDKLKAVEAERTVLTTKLAVVSFERDRLAEDLVEAREWADGVSVTRGPGCG